MVTYIWPPQSVSVSVPPLEFFLNGAETPVSRDTGTPANSNPLPVTQLDSVGVVVSPLTDAQLRATAVPVSGPLTDTQLRATPVPISGTVTANTGLSQPLTDTQLRATPVPISGTVTANTGLSQPLTDTQLRAAAVPVSGPLTDAELRATPVAVSGTVTANTGLSQPLTDTQLRATAVPVSGPLTDAQLRASAIAVTQSALTASYAESLIVDTLGVTITAPAGAKWCKVQADGTNSANLRMKIGAVATISSGIVLEAGRSEDFSAAGNISVFAESGSGQKVYVQFGA